MIGKSIIIILTQLMLLLILTIPSEACDCQGSPPGPCYKCQYGIWVPCGLNCPACYTCVSLGASCDCAWACGQGNCCNGNCCNNTCCNGNCCNSSQNCCNGVCCDNPCCNGICCPEGQTCVNNNCECITCWTTQIDSILTVPCPDCSGFFTGCEGSVPIVGYHYHWVPAAPGEIGWCNNPTKEEQVGSWHECTEDWNGAKILECAAGHVICHYICETGNWTLCLACLIAEGIDCALEGVCSFVEDCIPGEEQQPIIESVVDDSGDRGESCFIFSP